MKHLFTAEGQAALATTMALRPLLAFDFDGTLAPIVMRPADAHVPVAVSRRLDRLAQILPLAIVTGRRVDDVRGRLTFQPHFVIGNHGAEDSSAVVSAGLVAVFDPLRSRLLDRAADLQAAGVTVEDKQHSLALHFRLARDRDAATDLIADLVSDLGAGLIAYGGKLVVNVVAQAAPDKAQAVAGLVEKCGARAAVFVGDDVNDEPVFARDEPSWLTIRVGRDDPNTQAKFCLDRPGEIATLLERMLELLGAVSK